MLLPPLRFTPILTTNRWGGRRLPEFLRQPPPEHEDPLGEAWVLSDVDGQLSRVADGPLAGATLRQLLADRPERILGRAKLVNGRFPLLLKFIDAREELSVQVHPDDEQAARSRPGANGKTEAWVVMDRNPARSRIYSGFASGMTGEHFVQALAQGTAPQTLHTFAPNVGDCVYLPAGTVHAIGAEILIFEVQQTSDITYRLYDWDRVDPGTGLPRELHVEQGLAVSNFASGPCQAVVPRRLDETCEELVCSPYFSLRRWACQVPFRIGEADECRIVTVLEANESTELEWGSGRFALNTGDTILIPAETGGCTIRPAGRTTILECAPV